jgi:hypothetical protein
MASRWSFLLEGRKNVFEATYTSRLRGTLMKAGMTLDRDLFVGELYQGHSLINLFSFL